MTRILDLFCGAGGFSTGFERFVRARELLGIDSDPFALQTYSLNHPRAIGLLYDIKYLHATFIEQILEGHPDIIIASPPCEEFSLANPESRHSAAERIYGSGSASLVLDTVRLIGDLEPQIFVVENVAAIARSGGREILKREFSRVGIDKIYFNLVHAEDHGNPSKRARLFISNVQFRLPIATPPSVIQTIGDLPSLEPVGSVNPDRSVPNHEIYPLNMEQMKLVIRTKWEEGARHHRSGHRIMTNWVRLRPNHVATSIIGISRYIHPYENRLLTVREHARLMGYPDSYIFVGPLEHQYNQVGESVPPLISALIAEEVYQYVR